jgi:predicted RNA-binding protein with PIN domain
MNMPKKEKAQEIIRVSTGDITQSAVAVGTGARAASDVSNRSELSEAKARLAQLAELLEQQELQIERSREIRDEVLAVQGELDKKRPNFSLIRSALKGIVVSLGPAQALATLAAQVLAIVRRLG